MVLTNAGRYIHQSNAKKICVKLKQLSEIVGQNTSSGSRILFSFATVN